MPQPQLKQDYVVMTVSCGHCQQEQVVHVLADLLRLWFHRFQSLDKILKVAIGYGLRAVLETCRRPRHVRPSRPLIPFLCEATAQLVERNQSACIAV